MVVYAVLLVLFLYSVNKKIKNGPYDEAKNALEII
jgi:cytochrome d ubiquinol oxidase subunit I